MKRLLEVFVALFVLVNLSACGLVFPFCEQVQVSGEIRGLEYTPAYHTTTCSGEGEDRDCINRSHSPTYILKVLYGDKIRDVIVDDQLYYTVRVGQWVSFPVCKDGSGG